MLIPEGLAYDSRTQSFLMGSINEKKIVRYDRHGQLTEFVPPGRDGLAEVLGIRMDPTGAVVGDTFYYITNSQIDHFQNGKVLHPETLNSIIVAKVELK